jgi:hypothetical protein
MKTFKEKLNREIFLKLVKIIHRSDLRKPLLIKDKKYFSTIHTLYSPIIRN